MEVPSGAKAGLDPASEKRVISKLALVEPLIILDCESFLII
jgi:hypothetical protein